MMISMFDREGDSQINPYEFEQLWNYLSQWRQTFNSFDADRSGQIDKQELANALQKSLKKIDQQKTRKNFIKNNLHVLTLFMNHGIQTLRHFYSGSHGQVRPRQNRKP